MNSKQFSLRLQLLVAALLMLLTSGICAAQDLASALSAKDTAAVIRLIDEGADINQVDKYGATFLMTACRWNDTTKVEFLLRHGATPDQPRSAAGRTALIVGASYYAQPPVFEALLRAGADINAQQTDGKTALMLASSVGNQTIVSFLLQHGADPKIQDKNGMSALDHARAAEISEDTKSWMSNFGFTLDKAACIELLEHAK